MNAYIFKIGIFRIGFLLKTGKALHIIKLWATMEGPHFRKWKRKISLANPDKQ